MADAVAAIASAEEIANTGNESTRAPTMNAIAPTMKIREAAYAGRHPRIVTTETTMGVRSKPRLLPAATADFQNAPE